MHGHIGAAIEYLHVYNLGVRRRGVAVPGAGGVVAQRARLSLVTGCKKQTVPNLELESPSVHAHSNTIAKGSRSSKQNYECKQRARPYSTRGNTTSTKPNRGRGAPPGSRGVSRSGDAGDGPLRLCLPPGDGDPGDTSSRLLELVTWGVDGASSAAAAAGRELEVPQTSARLFCGPRQALSCHRDRGACMHTSVYIDVDICARLVVTCHHHGRTQNHG